MSAGVAIIAALPREVRGLVGRVRPEASRLGEGIHLYRLQEAVVVTAGMGSSRVSLAFEAAKAASSLETVVSIGLAGACTPRLSAGAVVEVATVVDARTGERFAALHKGEGLTLATVETIAGVQEKSRLAATYGAALVDMEAATLARLAQAHGVGFRSMKGISDPHDFELASLQRFTSAHGGFRTAAFALHTALRPAHWRPAAALGRHSNRALGALWERVQEELLQTS